MLRTFLSLVSLAFILAAADVRADEPAADEDKLIEGMSIVGNDEAPKSLVIVPWKSAALADTLDVSRGRDDGRGPVDPEVFARELEYYEIRVGQQGVPGSAAR